MGSWNSRYVNGEAHTFPCDENGDPAEGHVLTNNCPCQPKDMTDVAISYLHREIEKMGDGDAKG